MCKPRYLQDFGGRFVLYGDIVSDYVFRTSGAKYREQLFRQQLHTFFFFWRVLDALLAAFIVTIRHSTNAVLLCKLLLVFFLNRFLFSDNAASNQTVVAFKIRLIQSRYTSRLYQTYNAIYELPRCAYRQY